MRQGTWSRPIHSGTGILWLAVLALCPLSVAQTIALVDSDRIFEELGEFADARELLEQEIDEWQAHADSLEEGIMAIEQDLDRTLMMSPERRRERERLLAEKKAELEEFVSAVFGPGGQIERRNEELVAPIIAQLNEAIREIGTEEEYDLILDISEGAVVYADESLDITDTVLERLAAGDAD